MKKTFLSFLIITVTLANVSLVNIASVQAATTDNTVATTTDNTVTTTDNTIKVSLDNIRDIMIENNLDIKIQYNAIQIANDEYHNAKAVYDNSKTVYDAIPDSQKENIESAYNAAKADYDAKKATYDAATVDQKAILQLDYDNATTAYNTAKNAYDAKNTYDAADATLTTKRDANKTAKTTYDQAVETKIYAAQTAYVDYLSKLSDVKLQEDTIKSNEKEEQVYKLQYENGFISKNKYTSLLQDNTTPTDKLKETKDAAELARIKLCNTLGINPEKNVIFSADITEDFEAISKINYDDDLGKMVENNIDIKDQNDDIDDLKDEQDKNDDSDKDNLYDHEIEQANNKLKLSMNDAEASFKEKYNTLMNSYNTIKSSYDSLTIENNTYSIMKIKHDYGFVSQKEVDDAKLTLDTNESDLQTNKNALYVNYLNYLQMKEGY